MNYKSRWVLLLILTTISAYTDVTMLNCPAQFNITNYNVTTDTTVATMGSFVYGALTSQSNQQKVQDIVVKGDYSELDSYISSMMTPYIIFASLFFSFFIVTALCCLFDQSCPPCESLRRDTDNNPYSKK